MAPILVSRDPGIIRAITIETGDGKGQFDRDTLPSTGIARATGKDTLLFWLGGYFLNRNIVDQHQSVIAAVRGLTRKSICQEPPPGMVKGMLDWTLNKEA